MYVCIYIYIYIHTHTQNNDTGRGGVRQDSTCHSLDEAISRRHVWLSSLVQPCNSTCTKDAKSGGIEAAHRQTCAEAIHHTSAPPGAGKSCNRP